LPLLPACGLQTARRAHLRRCAGDANAFTTRRAAPHHGSAPRIAAPATRERLAATLLRAIAVYAARSQSSARGNGADLPSHLTAVLERRWRAGGKTLRLSATGGSLSGAALGVRRRHVSRLLEARRQPRRLAAGLCRASMPALRAAGIRRAALLAFLCRNAASLPVAIWRLFVEKRALERPAVREGGEQDLLVAAWLGHLCTMGSCCLYILTIRWLYRRRGWAFSLSALWRTGCRQTGRKESGDGARRDGALRAARAVAPRRLCLRSLHTLCHFALPPSSLWLCVLSLCTHSCRGCGVGRWHGNWMRRAAGDGGALRYRWRSLSRLLCLAGRICAVLALGEARCGTTASRGENAGGLEEGCADWRWRKRRRDSVCWLLSITARGPATCCSVRRHNLLL